MGPECPGEDKELMRPHHIQTSLRPSAVLNFLHFHTWNKKEKTKLRDNVAKPSGSTGLWKAPLLPVSSSFPASLLLL